MLSKHATSIVKENCPREDFTTKIFNINFLSELENFDPLHTLQRKKEKKLFVAYKRERKRKKERKTGTEAE